MGMLSKLGFARDVAMMEYSLPAVPGDVAQVSDLPAEVAAAFGINLDTDHVTREQAMSVPAVRRGRQIICGTLGAVPLVCVRSRAGKTAERVERQLLSHPDPNTTRSYTLTQTLDALLFDGLAWWRILERGTDGYPSRAEWLNKNRIQVNLAARTVYVDGKPVSDRDVIRFDAPDEGVLKHGARTIKTALMLEEAVRRYARMDVPLGLLEDQDGSLTTEETQTLLDSWELARRARTTGYLPRGIKYNSPAFDAQKIELAAARDHQSAEIARLMNLPPDAVNAPSNDSLTYATTESNRRQLVDLTFAPFVSAVQDRLSMPDVTPNGTKVVMDLSAFQRGDITAVMTAAKIGIEAGVITPDEVRADWLNLPPLNKES